MDRVQVLSEAAAFARARVCLSVGVVFAPRAGVYTHASTFGSALCLVFSSGASGLFHSKCIFVFMDERERGGGVREGGEEEEEGRGGEEGGDERERESES